MNPPVKIFRFGVEDAAKVASSSNEPHIHDFEEILIGMEGAIEHFIDFEATTLNAPYVCFVTKGKVHRVKPIIKDGKCDVWVIRFNSEFLSEVIFHLYTSFHNEANLPWPIEKKTGRIPALTEMMYQELNQNNPNFSLIGHLLNAVISMVMVEKKSQSEEVNLSTQNETFINFLDILEENYKRPVGVNFYAEKLFMSSRNLNLICQNVLHQSVSEIIETRKLIEAKNLLSTTNLSIAEIGFELGYKEKAYFSNVFKKKAGQTPTEFRNEMKKLLG
ncbi:MAG: helix-turn-helix transcriptional regulator [Saprospiraceae bacterium]|nr:helix-turn-helix transcriptional regulator [Saprospiraceae bacterium]